MSYSDELTEAKLINLEIKLRKEYKRAATEARKRASAYFNTLEQRYQQEYEAYQRGEYTTAQFNAWYITQVKRGEGYQRMADDLAKRVVEANQTASAYINDATPSIYALNFNYSAYEISQAYGPEYNVASFQLYNEQAAKEVLTGKNHVEFKTTHINPRRDYKWNRQQIDSALVSGIMQGKPIDKLAESFMTVMERNRSSAVRNARTAVTSAQNGGRLESYRRAQEMGIYLKKEWMATFDGRTRDSHAQLDGERVDYDDKFSNGLLYPGDPDGRPAEVYNCRCTMRAILPDINDEKRETYDEWANRMRANEDQLTDRQRQKAGKVLDKPVNYAKAIDYIEHSTSDGISTYTPQMVLKNMQTSPVGREMIRFIRDGKVRVEIVDDGLYHGVRGEQKGKNIKIFASSIKNEMVAGQSLIHEVVHYKYNIGNCQHAEAVCFAYEKMHKEGRDFLYPHEWEYVKQLAIDNYPELEWERGGYGNFSKFDFVKLQP